MKFILLGDDFPALKIYHHLLEHEKKGNLEILGVFSSNDRVSQLGQTALAHDHRFESSNNAIPSDADWLLNINSTIILSPANPERLS